MDAGVYIIESLLIPPPAFDFLPRDAFKIYDFFPHIAIKQCSLGLNSDLLTSFYDLVLSLVLFSPNFLSPPLDFLPRSPNPLIGGNSITYRPVSKTSLSLSSSSQQPALLRQKRHLQHPQQQHRRRRHTTAAAPSFSSFSSSPVSTATEAPTPQEKRFL